MKNCLAHSLGRQYVQGNVAGIWRGLCLLSGDVVKGVRQDRIST